MARTSKLLSALTALALVAVSGVGAATASAQLPSAGAPHVDDVELRVPQGVVEHTVTLVKVERGKSVIRHERVEQWLSRYRSRTIATDVASGRRLREIAYVTGETRSFDVRTRTLRIQAEPGKTRPAAHSLAFQAALTRWQLAQGNVRAAGETTVAGRPALRLASGPGADDLTMTATVDAETFALRERRYALPDGAFTQTETVTVSETLPATPTLSARLAMTSRKRLGVRRVVRNG